MESNLSMGGQLAAKLIRGERAGLGWKIRNAPHVLSGVWRAALARLAGIPTLQSRLEAVLIRADGSTVNYGVLGTRMVTTAFVTALATYMYNGSSVNPTAYTYHASGTGSTAEAVGDTALVTDSGVARVSGTASNPGAGQYRNVATMSYVATQAIVEHGLFSAVTAGTLMDRTVFAAINVVSGDSIQFTYTLTLNAGG